MAKAILMPKLGLTMTEGTIDTWEVKVGDSVKKGDAVCSISSEKLTADVEAPEDGVILEIVAEEGADVPCKEPIAYVGAEGEMVDSGKGGATEDVPEPSEEPVEEQPVAVESPAATGAAPVRSESAAPARREGERIFITPLARKLAAEKGIDYAEINGTGGNGRITRRDVLSYVPAAKPVQSVPTGVEVGAGLKGMRKMIAARMISSLQNTAQVTIHQKADITKLMAFRKETKAKAGYPLTDGQLSITTLLTRAVVLALKETPEINSWYQNGTLEHVEDINIGIAVAVDDGLVVPVVKHADQLTLTGLGQSINSVISDTRAGTLAGDLYSGSTFTISNLGHTGVEYFTPIINTPEIGILGVGSLTKELAFDEAHEVVELQKLPLSLTFDHQIVDGSPAADFLKLIIENLQNPYKLVL